LRARPSSGASALINGRALRYLIKIKLPLLTRVGVPAVISSQWMLLISTVESPFRLAFVVV
jgi:hypothetical protein